jgi:hypothetical protein
MPQDGAQGAAEAFIALENTASKYNRLGSVVILGDLNAKTGPAKNTKERRAIGGYGDPHSRTSNGKLLVNMLVGKGLTSLLGQKPPPARARAGVKFWYTRYDWQHKVHTTIDYVLVSSEIVALHPKCYIHVGSDHHVVGAMVPCPRKTVRRRGRKAPRRNFRFEKLIQKSSKKEDAEAATKEQAGYERELEAAFEGFDASAPRRRAEECECARGKCVCAVIGEFIERTERALEKSIGSKITRRKFTRGWFDQVEAAREAVKARREAYTNFRANPTEENWKTFKSKRMGATRIVARNKAKDWADFIDGFGADFKRDHKKLWQRVSRIVPTGKVTSLAPIKKLDGSLATTEEEIFDAWADHYERLGTAGNKPEFDDEFKRLIETEVAEKRKQSYLEPQQRPTKRLRCENWRRLLQLGNLRTTRRLRKMERGTRASSVGAQQ